MLRMYPWLEAKVTGGYRTAIRHIGNRQAWWHISKSSTPAAEMGAVNLQFSKEMGVLATVLAHETRGSARGGGTELVLTD